MKKIIFALLLALFPLHTALAQTPVHALAIHGAPKYAPDFKHFEYVNPDAPKGGTLRLNSLGTFDSLNPFILKGVPADGVGAYIYESLMEKSQDEPFTMYCLLCETVEVAPDRSSITFNLRPNAKWHDGVPVTAEDVVWTFNALTQKGNPFYKSYYKDVKSVTAESPSRVKFTFNNGGNRELPLIVGEMTVLSKHYWEGKKFDESSLEVPVGSGPYKVGAVRPGHSIEFIRVKDWWGKDLAINKGRWNFDRITYDYYRDGDVALEAFLGGQYDVRLENVAKLWATAYNAPPVQDGRIIKEDVAHEQPQGMQGFLYNTRRPVFADPKVREALAYAFDFEWSNKQYAYGAYKRSRSYFSNSFLAATGVPTGRELEILEQFRGKIPDRVFTTEYNPPKTDGTGNNRENLRIAGKILDDAGYAVGADGVRTKGNVKLEFEILDNNPQFERWVLPFIKNLERIGVKAKFRSVDASQYQNRIQDFDFDMTIGTIPQSNSPGNEQRNYWSSAAAKTPGSRNYIGVNDPVIDTLVEKIITAESDADLKDYAHALDRVLQWNFYLIPHWHINTWRIARAKYIVRPEKLSPQSPGVADTWWADARD